MPDKKPCPECGKEFFPSGWGAHRRGAHGIEGTARTTVRSRERAADSTPVVIKTPTRRRPNHNFKQLPYLVLEDEKGGIWIAEKIR